MAWLKLHTDIWNDPKLKRAARAGAKGLELLPWLLVFAKIADDDGRLSVGGHAATPEEIADGIPSARATAALVTACQEACLALGVLVHDYDRVLRFASWGPRQGKASESREAVAERVRRHRAKRSGFDVKRPGVTPPRGVTVTTQTGVTVTQDEMRGEEKRGEVPPYPPNLTLHRPPPGAPATGAPKGPGEELPADPDALQALETRKAEALRRLRAPGPTQTPVSA
jgi:hypothetical protein